MSNSNWCVSQLDARALRCSSPQLDPAVQWDTTGLERFRALASAYHRGAHGLMFFIDLTNASSLELARHFASEADSCAETDLPRVLVGCKCDERDKVRARLAATCPIALAPHPHGCCGLAQRKVSRAEADALATELGCFAYIETSALTGENVDAAFQQIAERALPVALARQASTAAPAPAQAPAPASTFWALFGGATASPAPAASPSPDQSREIAELRRQLAERDAALSQARRQLGDRDAVAAALRADLAQLDRAVAAHAAAVTEAHTAVAAAAASIARLEAELAAARAAVASEAHLLSPDAESSLMLPDAAVHTYELDPATGARIILGSGADGIVFAGSLTLPVALKQVNRPPRQVPKDFRASVYRESLLQRSVTHRNVLSVVGLRFPSADQAMIALERGACSLSGALHKGEWRSLPSAVATAAAGGAGAAAMLPPLDLRLRWADGVIAGVAHLHECHIVHADLKAGNTLIAPDGVTAKVCDFGRSVLRRDWDVTTRTMRGEKGSPAYMAPELLRDPSGAAADKATDVYSCGVLLWEVLTALSPYADDASVTTLADVQRVVGGGGRPCGDVSLLSRLSPAGAGDLIARMWSGEKAARPSMREVAVAWSALRAGGGGAASAV